MARVEAGVILGGKYRLERPIGRGGMGWVWMAQHLEWQAPVAIKLIDIRQLAPQQGAPAELADSPLLQRFFNEARAAASIRSPHVVQILDHGVDPTLQLPFIVMELLEGETLDQRLARDGRLDPELTTNILSQVARALTRVHEANMVHRDLKPSNVFLVANEEDVVAKVLDFGIAKANTGTTAVAPITATGEQMGTPFYMCPEQVRGQRNIDSKADLWAFGVIAYECLTGSRPFDGETLGVLSLRICVEPLPLPSRAAAVPSDFDAWFLRAVDRDRTRTFSSAKEAADALRKALGSSAVTLSPAQIPGGDIKRRGQYEAALDTTTAAVSSVPSLPFKRRRRIAAIGAVLFVCAGILGAGLYLQGAESPASAPRDEPLAATPSSAPLTPAEVSVPSAAPADAPRPLTEPFPERAAPDSTSRAPTPPPPALGSPVRSVGPPHVDRESRSPQSKKQPNVASVGRKNGPPPAPATTPAPAQPSAKEPVASPLDLIESRL